jgi:hypothetical protein
VKRFKDKIRRQILADVETNDHISDKVFKGNSIESDIILSPTKESADNDILNAKRKLLEPEMMYLVLNREEHERTLIRKLFASENLSKEIHKDEAKSPNIRERCLMNVEMLKGNFTFNLPIPIGTKKSYSEQNNINPFKEIKDSVEVSLELDFESNSDVIDSNCNLTLDYSCSPIVMMRKSNQFEDFESMMTVSKEEVKGETDLVRIYESRFEKEFEVLGEIGKGYYGVIKRCRNRLDGLEYAVKITKHKWRGECGKREALREVFALSALSVCDDNPYIVKYFSGWIEDSKLYIVVS